MVEVLGRAQLNSAWRRNSSLKNLLKDLVTCSQDLALPRLLHHLLATPHSQELIIQVLELQRRSSGREMTGSGRSQALEQQLVALLHEAMEMAETGTREEILADMFRDLANKLHYFGLIQGFVSLPHVISDLADIIEKKQLKAGRDKLMWLVLQVINGSNYAPVLRLYSMYSGDFAPAPVPDTSLPSSLEKLAATAVFIFIKQKVMQTNLRLSFSLPACLEKQYEYLKSLSVLPVVLDVSKLSYNVSINLAAFSTFPERREEAVTALAKSLSWDDGTQQGPLARLPGNNCVAAFPVTPLPMALLDSLTLRAKMILFDWIVKHIDKKVEIGPILRASRSLEERGLSPSLVETYSRLLVYPEIEGVSGHILTR